MDLNTYLALVVVVGIFDGIGVHLTILKLNALGNLLQVLFTDILVEEHMIHLFFKELRMRELAGQVAIVGKQQHTRGVSVKASNRIDALRAGILHKVHNCLALLGIITCGDIILGLVEQHINFLLQGDGLVVELHLIRALHLHAKLRCHYAIDGDNTSLDKLIGFATRANARIGQIFIKTDRLVGVNVLLLVLDALLHAILGIGIVSLALAIAALTLLIATLALAIATLAGLVATLTGLIATLTLAVATLAGLITAITLVVVTRTIATLALAVATLAGLVTLAGLITAILLIIVIARTITTLSGLVAAILLVIVVAWAITALARLVALLTRLVAAILQAVVVAWAITTLARLACLVAATLQASSEALGTEARLTLSLPTV